MKRSMFTESTVSIGGPVAQPEIAAIRIKQEILFKVLVGIKVLIFINFIMGEILVYLTLNCL
jgi:hypothetical protein